MGDLKMSLDFKLPPRIPLDDVQVREALEQIQHDYQVIARLKTLEDRMLQATVATPTIQFFEMRIRETEYALYKAGVQNFNSAEHKLRSEKERLRSEFVTVYENAGDCIP